MAYFCLSVAVFPNVPPAPGMPCQGEDRKYTRAAALFGLDLGIGRSSGVSFILDFMRVDASYLRLDAFFYEPLCTVARRVVRVQLVCS